MRKTPQTLTAFDRWLPVALLWVVALLNYLDRQMLSTMRPSMQVDITELQSAETFGQLMAIFLWVYGLSSPLAGWLSDRLNRKTVIIGSLLVWSAITLAMGYAQNLHQLIWLRGFMGLSEAFYIPAAMALIADYHPSKTRSLAVGVHLTGLYMGQALGGFGATIAKTFSWQHAFFSFGIFGIAYALLLVLLLRNPPKAEGIAENQLIKEPVGKLRTLFTTPAFWLFLLYFAVPSLPGWGIKNWLPTLYADNLHLDMAVAGPLATITVAMSSFMGVFIGGPLSDRWVQRHLKGRIWTSAIGLGLTIPALLFIGYGQSLAAVVAATFLFGVGYGMFDTNNMPILCQLVPENLRATAYGLLNLTGISAGALVTRLLGKASDSGSLGYQFVLMGGVVAVALVVQLLFLKPKQA